MAETDTDLSEAYRALNDAKWARSKQKRSARVESWNPDGRWTERSGYWQTVVRGSLLRYWPSTGTFDYQGRVYSKVVGSKRIVRVRGHEHVLKFIEACERRAVQQPAPKWRPLPGEFS